MLDRHKHENGQLVVKGEYHTMGDFLRACRTDSAYMETSRRHASANGSWCGAQSFDDAERLVRNGLPQYRERINALVGKCSVNLPSEQDAWVADVAGCAPIVPAAIAGLPDNMLRLEKQPVSDTPLRIFVSCMFSAMSSDEFIAQRGVAICALLETLTAKRPVELWLYVDLDAQNSRGFASPIVRVESMPLDQSAITAALVSPAFGRLMCQSWCYRHAHYQGGWAWGADPENKRAQELTRAELGAAPQDLVIFGGHIKSKDVILTDPAAWVAQQIKLTEDNLQNAV